MANFPVRVDIEVTNFCSLKCPMCPRQFMTRPMGFMSVELVEKIVSEVVEKKGENFSHIATHQIGEPLLHPRIVEIVSIISRAGIPTVLTTSGFNLTSKLCEGLFRAGLGSLSISLDSIDPKVYNTIRVGSDLDVVMQNIDAALEIRSRIPESNTVIDLQTIKMFSTVGQGDAIESRWGDKVRQFGGKVIRKNFAHWGGSIGDLASAEDDEGDSPCVQMNISEVVQWDGNVTICCLDFDGKTRVGNVWNETLEEIWTGEKYTSLRKRIRSGDTSIPSCGTCPHLFKQPSEEDNANQRSDDQETN